MSETPNPGTKEAIAAGCICPVMDNYHGRGWRGQEGVFIYTEGCPVHPIPAHSAENSTDNLRKKEG